MSLQKPYKLVEHDTQYTDGDQDITNRKRHFPILKRKKSMET